VIGKQTINITQYGTILLGSSDYHHHRQINVYILNTFTAFVISVK